MHKLSVQIRFNDIDGVGHVNNNAYGEYFDIGRLDYFEKALGQQMNWRQGKTMVLVHIEANFMQQVFLYDRIEVHTMVTEVGNRSVKMLQRIVATDGSVKVEGRSILSTYDFETGNSFPIWDEWREKILAFERQSQ